jgi:hypothetical protein
MEIERELSDRVIVGLWTHLAYMTTSIRVGEMTVMLDVNETLSLLEILESNKGKLTRTRIMWENIENGQ